MSWGHPPGAICGKTKWNEIQHTVEVLAHNEQSALDDPMGQRPGHMRSPMNIGRSHDGKRLTRMPTVASFVLLESSYIALSSLRLGTSGGSALPSRAHAVQEDSSSPRLARPVSHSEGNTFIYALGH